MDGDFTSTARSNRVEAHLPENLARHRPQDPVFVRIALLLVCLTPTLALAFRLAWRTVISLAPQMAEETVKMVSLVPRVNKFVYHMLVERIIFVIALNGTYCCSHMFQDGFNVSSLHRRAARLSPSRCQMDLFFGERVGASSNYPNFWPSSSVSTRMFTERTKQRREHFVLEVAVRADFSAERSIAQTV